MKYGWSSHLHISFFSINYCFRVNHNKIGNMRFFAYNSIASRTNRIDDEMNTSTWRSNLNLDFVFRDFFQKLYFAGKLGISVRDRSKFCVICLSQHVTWKSIICDAIMIFGVKRRKQSLDNLSVCNIFQLV